MLMMRIEAAENTSLELLHLNNKMLARNLSQNFCELGSVSKMKGNQTIIEDIATSVDTCDNQKVS